MVSILYIHKLDITKYFKALSAAIPCNLHTVLNIKSPYLCRPNQNNSLKPKDSVYLVKLCQGYFAQCDTQNVTIHAPLFSMLIPDLHP